jgi:hypothetical protein
MSLTPEVRRWADPPSGATDFQSRIECGTGSLKKGETRTRAPCPYKKWIPAFAGMTD